MSEKESFIEIDEIELEPIPISEDQSSGRVTPKNFEDELGKPYGDINEELFPQKGRGPFKRGMGPGGYAKA